MDEARTGGTIERPGNLYPPGTGRCPTCGETVPTVAGGRMTAHGPTRLWGEQSRAPGAQYRTRTCPGWGYPVARP